MPRPSALVLILLAVLAWPSRSAAQEPIPAAVQARARSVRERARVDDTGYEVLRSLTSEVGPRSAGSPGDRRAIAWALAKLTSLGFQNVHAESVTVPHWIRGTARVETVSPWPQRFAAATLGGSIATPAGGLEAEVVRDHGLREAAVLHAHQLSALRVAFAARQEVERHPHELLVVEVVVGGQVEGMMRRCVDVEARPVGMDHGILQADRVIDILRGRRDDARGVLPEARGTRQRVRAVVVHIDIHA